jgi:hypothetical protein
VLGIGHCPAAVLPASGAFDLSFRRRCPALASWPCARGTCCVSCSGPLLLLLLVLLPLLAALLLRACKRCR